MRAGDHQQRVAVGRRLGDEVPADRAAGARLVLDDELLAERSDSFWPRMRASDVGEAAGREAARSARPAGRIVCANAPAEMRAARPRGSEKGAWLTPCTPGPAG